MDEAASNRTNSSAAAARISPVPSSNAPAPSSNANTSKRNLADAAPMAHLTAESSIPAKRAKSGNCQRSSTVATRSQEEDSTGSGAMPDAPTSGAPHEPTENVRVPPPAEAGALVAPGASHGPGAHPRLQQGASAALASVPVVTKIQGNLARTEAAPKSAEDISKEVRELLEDTLMGKGDDEVKVAALRTLAGYFKVSANFVQDPAFQQMSPYRNAVSKWHGCHLVLVLLRQELAKVDGPNRDIVLCVVQFLAHWNAISVKCRNEMSRFNGVDALVSVMQTSPNDKEIQKWSIGCLFNFTLDGETKRCVELVKGNAIVLIFRAMTTNTDSDNVQKHSVVVLGRLCDFASSDYLEGLVEMGALEALVQVYKAHKNSSDPRREEICASCSKWMTKLVV